jgi:outer membrane protein assembly factor BamB
MLLIAFGATAPAAAQRDRFERGRLISLPRSQDDVFEWNKAREAIAAGAFAEAVERLHGLLRRGRAGVVPLDEAEERFMGLRMAVVTTLRDLPEAGQAAYEKLVEREAGQQLRAAFEAGSLEQLAMIAEEFPASQLALRARLRLGDLALESGDGLTAQSHYLAARDGLASTSPRLPVLAARMAAARVAAGAPPPDDGLAAADLARARAVASALPTRATATLVRGWPAIGGDGANPMRAPGGELLPQWQRQIVAPGFDANPYAMHAVGGLAGLFVTNGHGLLAFDPLTGEELWRNDGPMLLEDDRGDYEESTNPEVVLAPACAPEIVVAALQVPTDGMRYYFRTIDVIRRIPARRLFAFDRSTGKLLWSHWDRRNGPVAARYASHDTAGPPLISGDTVYVASHDQTGAIAYYLSAYDLRTGEPKWRQLICSSQGAVNMFGNALMEFAASPLALHDGVVYGTTNVGACYAADAASGRVRWITTYEVIALPETQLTHQRMRDVFFANSAIAVTDGVVACTPIDSAYALGFDASSGEPLWRMFYRDGARGAGAMRWLLGAIGDEFIFAGVGVVAVKARPDGATRPRASCRLVKSPESLQLSKDYGFAQTMPCGALTADRIFFPSPAGLQVFDVAGDIDRRAATLRGNSPLGNLLLVDGLLVSLRSHALDLYYDAKQLLADAERLAAREPDNAAALLALASLTRAAAGDNIEGAAGDAAVRHYQHGLEVARASGMSASSPLYRRMASELFQLTLARARRLGERSPERAVAAMRGARDAALEADQWIAAQKWVLKMLADRPQAYLEELQLLAREHGGAVHDFEGIGKVPVAAWALWETAHLADPRQAIEACQELLERYGNERFGTRSAAELAAERQIEVIRQHGRNAYAAIEKRAAEALARAAGDADLLRGVAATFPHSAAAIAAVQKILDVAIERGDIATAAGAYGQAVADSEPPPGLLRRMASAARAVGNSALANAFAGRALDQHGDTVSDLPADGGRRLRDVLAIEPLAEPATAPAEPPLRIVAELLPDAFSASYHVRELEPARGFATPAHLPLYLCGTTEQLQAFDLRRGAKAFDAALFSVPHRYLLDREPLYLCGETLILFEGSLVQGIHCSSGAEKWRFRAEQDRLLTPLGIEHGVLLMFSELTARGDGGAVVGLEPLTGSLLFRRSFPALAESIAPVASGSALWRVDSRGNTAAIERIDPLSGRTTHRVPLGESLLARLQLGARGTESWLRSLPLTLFADADTLYLPVEPQTEAHPARLAAVDFAGELRWPPWIGASGRLLSMAAERGQLIAILEGTASTTRSSRLVLIDKKSGNAVKERLLGPMARVLNWRRSSRCQPAPAHLLIEDRSERRNVNLNYFALEGDLGSFSYALRGPYAAIASTPVIGPDFVAIAAEHDRGRRLALMLLDLRSRRSLLPDGAAARSFPLERPNMFQCGAYTVVQSNEGITILGQEGSEPR